MAVTRCPWCGEDPLYVAYHDREWGVPSRDDRALFEMLTLDGAQAGLSWITILRKREAYRAAFKDFNPAVVAEYGEEEIAALMQTPGIVHNSKKVRSVVQNAQVVLRLQQEHGSLSEFLWSFVQGRTRQNAWRRWEDVPAFTPESEAMSKALKQAGCSFVGPTILYAFMQAAGMANDHLVSCFRHAELGGRRR